MDNMYVLMVVALGVLAIIDLVVGVSNDAVNFLNSAIGSKALKMRTILILASFGILIGAIFSNGMMEVARKGIFHPDQFMFNEIMIIFIAVMITDVLLLDFFNNVGMPTSTTVSIVFDLLGASVVYSLIKISNNDESFSEISKYINYSSAIEIIVGILLSVVIAFSVGILVQWISRLFMSFNYQQKPAWMGATFASIAFSALTYFIILNGIKGTSFADAKLQNLGGVTVGEFVNLHTQSIIVISLVSWFIISWLLIKFLHINLYKGIIGVGTFALALAFASNDLVNFIGVPIAGFQSFQVWENSGIAADQFSMSALTGKVQSPIYLLVAAGTIMILTLWFSKKAKSVTETEINLAREGESNEKFEPNYISRGIVRFSSLIAENLRSYLPEKWNAKIEQQFEKPVIHLSKDKTYDLPAFDSIRASVNLMLAAMLISFATSMHLPLSTTYVTFMVAMGTSLADRAWGAESAVYRVAGVLNVIGGWFFTALIAFVSAGIITYLIHLGGPFIIAIFLLLAILILVRNYILFKKKNTKILLEDQLQQAESKSIKGVMHESADNIARVVKRSNKIYSNDIDGLINTNLKLLRKNKNQITKLSEEIENLRENIFFFIKNLDEPGSQSSKFYINIISYLQDISESLESITKMSFKHVNNNHKKLKANQIEDLKEVESLVNKLFTDIQSTFSTENFGQITTILSEEHKFLDVIEAKIQKQIERTRKDETSPKNTTLYFSILLETKDLLEATIELLEEYNNYYKLLEA